MARTKPLTTLTFRVEGSDAGRLELDVLPELVAYKRLVVETAKDLWRRANPSRANLPNNFEASIRLQIEGSFKTNSTSVPVIREYADNEAGQSLLSMGDVVDDAADLIEETIGAAVLGTTMPDRVSLRVVSMFEKFGKGLRGQDSITLKSERRREAVVFDAVVRDRLAKWTPPIYQDIVRVTGEVTEADVVSHKFKITLPHDGVIEGQFPPERELDLTSALHKHAHVRVTISGSGEYSSHDASLVRIVRIDAIEPATTAEDGYDFSAPPIWEMAAAIGAAVPIEEWDKVPTDLARNFDRYAYGPGGNEPD